MSCLTLGAIVIYAVLVYLQYREMIYATGAAQQAVVETRRNRLQAEKALNATVEQFHLDQRAWVGVPTVEGRVVGINGALEYRGNTFHLKNTGRTPARKVGINFVMSTQRISQPIPSYSTVANNARKKIKPNMKGGILQSEIKPGKGGEVIPPDVDYPIIVTRTWNYSQYSGNPPEKQILIIQAEITYFDIFDKQRTTRACIMFLGPGDFNWCPVGNSME